MKSSHLTFLITTYLAGAAAAGGASLRGERSLGDGNNNNESETCGNTKCNVRAICQDGGCVCRNGFVEPPYCRDINECLELDILPCQYPGAACVDMTPTPENPVATHKCVCKTKEGWVDGPMGEFGPVSCLDNDECAADNSPCHANATCTNVLSPTRFVCTCDEGLITADGGRTCVEPPPDVQPILGNSCVDLSDCLDTPFSTCDTSVGKCICSEGYFSASGAGGQCQARNYCEEGKDDCDESPRGKCLPLLGDAPRGFFTCFCTSGYTTFPGKRIGRVCVPVNECISDISVCGEDEVCINLDPPQNYKCTPRTPQPTEAPTPAPITPAPVVPTNPPRPPCTFVTCISDATCVARTGFCQCNEGLSGDGLSICLDENNVTPDTIFGSGNANGGFTIARQGGVEVALRAKVRYDSKNNPNGRSIPFAFDGDRTYTFMAGDPIDVTKKGRARWNFDWSINSDYDDTVSPTGKKLIDFDYFLTYDIDASESITAPLIGRDPVKVLPYLDNQFGDNDTGNGGASKVGPFSKPPTDDEIAKATTDYAELLNTKNVVQNSDNYGFRKDLFEPDFDPTIPGIYTVSLEARKLGTTQVVAKTSIDVITVDPELAPPGVIYGSGNDNKNFMTSRKNGIELGLRGKVRYQGDNNANSDGTYDFKAGNTLCCGGTPEPRCCQLSQSDWNFDFSINVNYDDSAPDRFLDDLKYELSVDFDTSADTNFLVGDPVSIAPPYPASFPPPSNAMGVAGTTSADKKIATTRAEYLQFISENTVAQNSIQLAFLAAFGPPATTFDRDAAGQYTIMLKAFTADGATELNSLKIDIFTVV